MKNHTYALIFVFNSWWAHATLYQVHATDSESSIQTTINTAFAGPYNTLKFNAGTYTLSTSLAIPCQNGGTITGPSNQNPATAILVGTFANDPLMILGTSGSSCSMTIEYLGFNGGRPSAGGGGGIYVPQANSTVSIFNNQFWGNQAGAANTTSMAGIYYDATTSTADSNSVVQWNTFGESGDCSNVMSTLATLTGTCAAGVWAGDNSGLTIKNNVVSFQEEGFKQQPNTNCDACIIQNNDFSNIHRTAIEFQVLIPTTGLIVQYNDIHDQYKPYFESFGISVPCCTTTGVTVFDNLLIANVAAPPASPNPTYIPAAIEIWGAGSTAESNAIQGYWANGIDWGSWGVSTVTGNTLCGPNMATGPTYIYDEESYSPPPTTTPNTTSSTCSTLQSARPSISPASGSYSSPPTVTLTTYQYNTTIYYTTDGSTPTTSSTIYLGPFTSPALPATIKAIQMWGVAPNPTSYPSGYGYVPGSVVSAAFTD